MEQIKPSGAAINSPLNRAPYRDVLLFLAFYWLSSVLFYTATWISYGAFEGGHPPYFSPKEYAASAGFQFLISLLLTIPIWYIVVVRLANTNFRLAILSHLFFLPLFVTLVYFLLVVVKAYFGWALLWGGYNTIWTLYIIGLFYLVQFGLIHAYVYYQKHKNDAKEKAQLREAALQSQITAMKAQLNPHFLHNLFNSINASIPPENEKARELIIQLSELFRYQNTASQQDLVPLKSEVEFIKNYLQLMKVRLKDRLQYQIEVDPDIRDVPVPPMLLQPLVENAITHGISPKVGVSGLNIRIQKKEDRLYFEISDTGQGIQSGLDFWNKGLGLSNTRQRLRQMYASELAVEPNFPSGLKVSFWI